MKDGMRLVTNQTTCRPISKTAEPFPLRETQPLPPPPPPQLPDCWQEVNGIAGGSEVEGRGWGGRCGKGGGEGTRDGGWRPTLVARYPIRFLGEMMDCNLKRHQLQRTFPVTDAPKRSGLGYTNRNVMTSILFSGTGCSIFGRFVPGGCGRGFPFGTRQLGAPGSEGLHG